MESLNIQQYAEGYATTGLVLRGATSGTYTISNQQIRWARYGQLVTFTITMENINGATPLGDMILEVDGVSGFPTPYIFKSFIFNVTSNGFGRDGIHHFVWNDTNTDWKFYSEALATDDDNINSPVVNANFTGVEDITISGSFLSNSVFP